ncbi:MAG: acyltransferase [Ruminococcaceae bacterium]|nr:acyltransferase [Oscillospiraceae bacterium]
MEKSILKNSSRNYGLDLLRIVSMLMIIVFHILGHGGLLNALSPLSINYEIIWFLEIMCYCAVNCYALISGYVGVESKYKYSKIVVLWLQVFFYAVLISVLIALFVPGEYINIVFKGLFPVKNCVYWYFTAYFGLFFCIPLINKALNTFDVKQLKIFGITIFAVFSLLPCFSKQDVFYTQRGYSFLWLTLLYILGGIIKKTNLFRNTKSYIFLIGYFVCCAVTWTEKLVVELLKNNSVKSVLVSYTSPTVLLSALMLLFFFSKLKTGKILSKVIATVAPLTFGVYLIHDNPNIRKHLIQGVFERVAAYNPLITIAIVLSTVICIFVICVLIDFLRDRLFKLLKVKERLLKLESKFIGKIW